MTDVALEQADVPDLLTPLLEGAAPAGEGPDLLTPLLKSASAETAGSGQSTVGDLLVPDIGASASGLVSDGGGSSGRQSIVEPPVGSGQPTMPTGRQTLEQLVAGAKGRVAGLGDATASSAIARGAADGILDALLMQPTTLDRLLVGAGSSRVPGTSSGGLLAAAGLSGRPEGMSQPVVSAVDRAVADGASVVSSTGLLAVPSSATVALVGVPGKTDQQTSAVGVGQPGDANAIVGPEVKGGSADYAAERNHRWSTTTLEAMDALYYARYEMRNWSETPDQAIGSFPRIRQLQDQIKYLEVLIRDDAVRLQGDVRSLELRRDEAAARGDLTSVADYWRDIGELQVQIDEIGRFLTDTTAYPPEN